MDPWYQTISEAQPLFFDRGEFRPYYAEAMLTWFVYLYPLMVVTLLVGRFRAKERSVAFDFLLFLLVTLGALGFLRKRLIYFSALNVSLCVAYFLVESVRLVWRKESAGRKPHGFVFRAARIAFIVVVCLVACYPSVNFYWPLSRERHAQARPFFTPPRAMRDTFAWMRDHTPATSFYMDPTRDPEYGVIFSYDYSVWLIFYARRPAIGVLWGLFRREGNDRAFDAFRFLVAESEAEANEICDRDRARYVVTYPILFFVRDYAAITGVDRDRYMVLTRREDTGRPVFRPTDRYWHLIGQRLHERDGVGTEDSPEALPSLQRYRLLYESESFVHPDTGKPSVLKIFEYVKGARITGLTMPLARVKAEVAMVTNQGRQFTYRNSVAADDQGRFTLIVPYATSGGKPGETHAVSRYRVNSLAVDAFADVTEEDILGGGEVRVVFPGRRP
jgi:dolichyl-diphosphooligosaccharide--protein glycosyltransferase